MTTVKPFSANPRNRRWARRFCMQALYQWEITHADMSTIEAQFLQDENLDRVDLAYFKELLSGVVEQLDLIQSYIKRYVDRQVSEIDPIELSILRLSIYELLKRPDVPYKVVVNEALELAKAFGATDGYKFVNGILDKVAREVRRDEISQK
ncbi:MAG TPA: transcription antitermination factor NusB [Gammaproteobacteria bacterium]|nr:transcription antitermination factor NusB [Gammaproteobacteria bacterium]